MKPRVIEDTKPPTFGLIVVPKSCGNANLWDLLIEKSKTFRLSSLKESPEAFASTYEREAAFAKDVWADRLANPQATQFVTVEDVDSRDIGDDLGKVRALVEKEWLAMTVLIEPQDNTVASISASQSPWNSIAGHNFSSQPSVLTEKITFILNGVYVAPGYRKQGVGIVTLKHVFEVGQAMSKARGKSIVHFEVRVSAANNAAFKLYEKAGFRGTRKEQLQVGEKVKNGIILPAYEAVIIVMERDIAVAA
jgi:ribosomal protein S18 acetylase RimI-like enzyme